MGWTLACKGGYLGLTEGSARLSSDQTPEPGANGRVEGMDAAGHPHLPHLWSQRGESSSHPPRQQDPGGGRRGSRFPSAPQFIPVYMHVRVLVAAYLFQTGYGHFSFFWLKGDFGLHRVCQVSFRPSSRGRPAPLRDAVGSFHGCCFHARSCSGSTSWSWSCAWSWTGLTSSITLCH